MADTTGLDRLPSTSVRATVRQALLTGFALTIPLFVTVLVVGFVVNSLSNILDPVVGFAFQLSGSRLRPSQTPRYLLKLIALAVLLTTVFCIGLVAERRSGPGRIEAVFDATIERIPGVGSLYTSFDEMSQMLLDSDTQSFREVVLVEHPTADSYTVAFVTASTPPKIERATDSEEMVTLFMPMAPNPVMGGHVVHVPAERVHDVDMTVEEGIRSIVTSGVAIGETGDRTVVGAQSEERDHGYPSAYWPGGSDPASRTRRFDREAAYSAAVDADSPASTDGGDTDNAETATDVVSGGDEQN